MFQVQLTNFNATKGPFETFEQAVAEARRCGFEASIWDDSIPFGLVASFSPISGLRDLRPFAGKTG